MKKISVIIPAYNCENYIERCVDSVLCQSGADTEVIVVNDGSTDNTAEKLKKYNGRIVLKSIKNCGAAGARNVGLQCANGDFVVFLDSDDYLKDGAISRLAEAQGENDADIVHFRYEYVFDGMPPYIPDCQADMCMFVQKSEFAKKVYPMFFDGIYLNSVCMSMFRRSVIGNLRFRTDMRTAEDAVFSLGAFGNAGSVQFIPDVIYEYYQSGSGLTGSGISVFRKYRDNFKFAAETARRLKEWNMNTPRNYVRVYFRPVSLTLDKLKRISCMAKQTK